MEQRFQKLSRLLLGIGLAGTVLAGLSVWIARWARAKLRAVPLDDSLLHVTLRSLWTHRVQTAYALVFVSAVFATLALGGYLFLRFRKAH